MCKYFIQFQFLFFFLCTPYLIAVDIGSDTAVTRFNTVQTVNAGDRIAGFAALEGGFEFASASVFGMFDSFFPVSGTVTLNGGSLILDRDLWLRNSFELGTFGTIVGNNQVLGLTAPATFSSGASEVFWSDLQMFLGGDTVFEDCLITFTGENIIHGRGSKVTFGSNCKIRLGSESALHLMHMTLEGVTTDRLQAIDNSGTFTFENMVMILDSDYTFSQGAFDIFGECTIAGNDHTFSYETDQVSTITHDATLTLEEDVTFHYAPPTATQQLLVMADDSASLWLKGATLSSDSTGMQLTKGNVFVEGSSFLSNGGSVLAEAIIFGDDLSAASNISMEWLPAAKLSLLQGFFRDANI